jgi:beta-mannanase
LCWELHRINFDSILRGEHDAYIRSYVAAAATYPNLVVLRPFHESNGNWYDWAPGSGRGYVRDARQWKEAWRHVVRTARTVPDSSRVKFYWCMNGGDAGGPSMESLWPGREWVDIIGADAYAWGGPAGGTFAQIHADAYRRITALHPTAEYWVGETGLDNQKGTAEWYREAYRSREFPRMTTVCWFHTDNFMVDRDKGSLAVHRAELRRAPQYAGRPAP